MMKSTTIRMDDDLKKEASAKLEALGLNFNTYVVMATKQLVAQNRIPFDLVVPDARSESEDKREEACQEAGSIGKYRAGPDSSTRVV